MKKRIDLFLEECSDDSDLMTAMCGRHCTSDQFNEEVNGLIGNVRIRFGMKVILSITRTSRHASNIAPRED